MAYYLAAAVAALSMMVESAAARPSSAKASGVLARVVAHYRSVGVPILVEPTLTVDAGDVSGSIIDPGGGGVSAYALPSEVVISPIVEAHLERFADALHGPQRAWRLSRCGGCGVGVNTLLHEVVHVAQYAAIPDFRAERFAGVDWYEGIASAVADDQYWPFIGRNVGRLTRILCGVDCAIGIAYPRQTSFVRLASTMPGARWNEYAARRWRLDAIPKPVTDLGSLPSSTSG